jgi:hypothetical protein
MAMNRGGVAFYFVFTVIFALIAIGHSSFAAGHSWFLVFAVPIGAAVTLLICYLFAKGWLIAD